MCHRGGMRVTGVDACRRGWVAVSLAGPDGRGPAGLRVDAVRVHASLAGVLEGDGASVVGIDMPLGLLESGWREADRAARGLLGPRRSSVFAIPPRAVWAQASYQAANQRCRELTGQGFASRPGGCGRSCSRPTGTALTCGHPLYEVHPELAFGAHGGRAAGAQQAHRGRARPAPRAAGPGRHRDPPGPAGPGHGHAGRGGRGLERLAHRHRPGRRHPRPRRSRTARAARSRSATDRAVSGAWCAGRRRPSRTPGRPARPRPRGGRACTTRRWS